MLRKLVAAFIAVQMLFVGSVAAAAEVDAITRAATSVASIAPAADLSKKSKKYQQKQLDKKLKKQAKSGNDKFKVKLKKGQKLTSSMRSYLMAAGYSVSVLGGFVVAVKNSSNEDKVNDNGSLTGAQ